MHGGAKGSGGPRGNRSEIAFVKHFHGIEGRKQSWWTKTHKPSRMYFGRGEEEGDQIGLLGGSERAIFGRSYAAEPDVLIAQLKQDEAIAEADTLLLTVPNQLGVDYNAHIIEVILKHVAPGLGWR